jgi:hypothetical protein
LNLGTLAAESPKGATPNIKVAEVAPRSAGKLKITVRNDGNGYARLRNGKWTLTSGTGQAATLEGEELAKAIEQPLIEAESTRVIELPVPDGFTVKGATAKFELARPSN